MKKVKKTRNRNRLGTIDSVDELMLRTSGGSQLLPQMVNSVDRYTPMEAIHTEPTIFSNRLSPLGGTGLSPL